MNKLIKNMMMGLAGCICLSVQSCDVLDVDPTNAYAENVTYASMANLDLYVKGFYSLLYTNADIACGSNCLMDDGASDLVKYSWYGVSAGAMNKFFYETNYVTPENNFRSNWSGMYENIRRLNEYFSDLSEGWADGLDKDELKIRTAEVRFLRAFAYQELVIRHGGVILRIGENAVDGPNERAKARSTEAECWDFILKQYEMAAHDLPDKWPAAEIGRVTCGAAYGMMARAALYAGRWSDAVTACDEVLKLGYDLMPGSTYAEYYKIFTTVNNQELILPVYFQQGVKMKQHSFDSYFCPPYDGNPWGASVGAAAAPSDEYASSFDIKVGDKWEPFEWDNLASKYGNKPWDNREPRFYASILYNGATWKGRTLELYHGGKDGYMDFAITGQDNNHQTTTGYIFRKYMSDDTKYNYTDILSGQYWIEMRLAEIYLIRSEAYARQNQFGPAYDDLKTIRDRVGLPALTQKGTWSDYLEDLAKERICELGLEGHRYHDLVRWGIAHETLDHKRLHGIKIAKAANDFTYTRVECDTQDRLFPEKYNVFPIPYTELKNNSLCEQTDVWK